MDCSNFSDPTLKEWLEILISTPNCGNWVKFRPLNAWNYPRYFRLSQSGPTRTLIIGISQEGRPQRYGRWDFQGQDITPTTRFFVRTSSYKTLSKSPQGLIAEGVASIENIGIKIDKW